MNNQYLIVDTDTDEVRFTSKGISELGRYFEIAGIEIGSIKTLSQYQQARNDATPHFLAWLEEVSSEWADNEQFNLMRIALFGTLEEVVDQLNRFDRKRSFRVVR
jgi:hypothetical protein